MSIQSSVRHIVHTEQPFSDLCEDPLPLSVVLRMDAFMFRVRTVAYESRCIFVSSLDCDIDFIKKFTFVNCMTTAKPLDCNT
jgi:hypothetical protein